MDFNDVFITDATPRPELPTTLWLYWIEPGSPKGFSENQQHFKVCHQPNLEIQV